MKPPFLRYPSFSSCKPPDPRCSAVPGVDGGPSVENRNACRNKQLPEAAIHSTNVHYAPCRTYIEAEISCRLQ